MLKKMRSMLKEYLSQTNYQLLRYNIILTIGIVALALIVIIEYFMNYADDGLIVLAALLLYLIIMAVLGNSYPKKLSLFSALVMALINFIIFPYLFLFADGGGVESGMPIWMTFGVILFFMMVDGIYFKIMLPLVTIVNVGVIFYAYTHQYLFVNDDGEPYYYLDNLIAILAVAFSIGMILRYQNNLESMQKKNIEDAMLAADKEKMNAQKANDAKTNFLASMSHDIRTPMNAIVGLTDIAKYNIDDKEKVQECLDKITTSSTQLLNLLNNILDMSEIEVSDSLRLKENQFSMEELLENIQLVLSQMARSRKLVLEFNCQVRDGNLVGDAVRLRQVLMNIISNSIKFTEAFGHVNVTVTQTKAKQEGYAEFDFVIEDTGVGMSQEFIDKHIFKPFERGDGRYVQKTEGSGIGMSITKGIIDAMGAELKIDSKIEKGTRFFIHAAFKMDNKLQNTITKEKDGTAVLDAKGKNLLVVEDNEINMEIIKAILERTHAHVVCAWDAEEAIDIISESHENYFDLILMDIQLPGMNGYSAARTIRCMDRKDSVTIPIIAMTANAFSQDVEKALNSGMNAHVAKPIDVDELFQKMYHFLYT